MIGRRGRNEQTKQGYSADRSINGGCSAAGILCRNRTGNSQGEEEYSDAGGDGCTGTHRNTRTAKKEAQALGWDSSYNYVSDVAPGKSIGGDYFGNYERKLPAVKGRKYYEADCFYQGGKRNAYRIIYSNDGHVWYTGDHYETFMELFPSS